MLLIHCPYCGEERPELEFRHAGEAHIARSASITDVSEEDFEAFLYLRANTKGVVYERWRHVHGCGRFFNAVRDSVTDRFFTTYKAGLPRPDPARFAKAVASVEPLVADPAVPVADAKPKPAARAPRKAAASSAVDEAPAPVAAPEAAMKPVRRSKSAASPEAAPAAAKPAPKRKASTATKAAETTAKAPAGKAGKPAEAGKSKAAPKRTRGAPVKKGEA